MDFQLKIAQVLRKVKNIEIRFATTKALNVNINVNKNDTLIELTKTGCVRTIINRYALFMILSSNFFAKKKKWFSLANLEFPLALPHVPMFQCPFRITLPFLCEKNSNRETF